MSNTIHTRDEQCTVDATTELCSICGVDHSQTCPDCDGKGFHTDTCFLWNPPARFVEEPFEEQRDIQFPAPLQALGFEDRSYRNDLAACAVIAVNKQYDLLCWVAADDPADREDGQTKFWVHSAPSGGDSDPIETFYDGEHIEECYRAIVAALKVLRGAPALHPREGAD